MAKGKGTGMASAVNQTPSPAFDKYQAESDFSTLRSAHEIQGDPKRHSAAKRHGRKLMGAAKAIVGRKY